MIDQFSILFLFLSIKYHLIFFIMVQILYFYNIDMHYTNVHYEWPTLVSNYFSLLNIIFNINFDLCFRLSLMESIGDEVHFILH